MSKKTTKRSPLATATVSTSEQVCTIHTDLINEAGIVVLTDPTFKEFSAGNSYEYTNPEQQIFKIEVLEKVTKADSGGHTWFKCIINNTEYPYQDIEQLKKLVGCTYRRKYGSKGERGYPKTEEQAEILSEGWIDNLFKKVSEIQKVLDSYNLEEQFDFEPLKEFIAIAAKQHAFNLFNEYKEEEQEKEQAAVNKERRKKLEKRLQILLKEGKYDEVKKILEKLEKL